MDAIVVNFRSAKHHIHNKQMVLKVGSTLEEAKPYVGKTVSWTSSSGKVIKGQIINVHGRKGNVRANFPDKGLPGQVLGQKIQVE